MKATIRYQKAVEEVNDEIVAMMDKMKISPHKALIQIGEIVAQNVKIVAPESDQEYYYYSGQKRQNVHIKDDVVYKVKYSLAAGHNYVSVSGGSKTWRKWHVVDEGHVAQNGRFIPGTAFVNEATIISAPAIDRIVDDMIGEIIK